MAIPIIDAIREASLSELHGAHASLRSIAGGEREWTLRPLRSPWSDDDPTPLSMPAG